MSIDNFNVVYRQTSFSETVDGIGFQLF